MKKLTNKQKILQRAYSLYEDKGIWLFSYKEYFPDMPHGSFRNSMSKLHKEGRTKTMRYDKYALTDYIPSEKDRNELINQIMIENDNLLQDKTVTNTVILSTLNAIRTCLQSTLWNEDNNIHNLTLTTSIPQLYKYLKSEGHTVDETNYGINIISTRINDNYNNNNLSLKAFIYETDTIEIFISNSNNPIMVNVEGIKRLRNTLEKFRIHLGQYTVNIPQLNNGFKVVKYDYARDGILPISVVIRYNYYNFENELIQIYTKRSNSFFSEIRFEKRDIHPHPNASFFGNFEQLLLGDQRRRRQTMNRRFDSTNNNGRLNNDTTITTMPKGRGTEIHHNFDHGYKEFEKVDPSSTNYMDRRRH